MLILLTLLTLVVVHVLFLLGDEAFLEIAREGMMATTEGCPEGWARYKQMDLLRYTRPVLTGAFVNCAYYRWEMRMDPNGDVYYVALNTNEQKRQHPLDHTYRHVFLEAKYGAQPGGDYLVLLLEMVKSRHLVDRVAAATMAELGRAAGIFGRLDPERGGRITLANFVLAMNALDVAQGKPLHKDTKLLAMFKAGDLAGTGEVSK